MCNESDLPTACYEYAVLVTSTSHAILTLAQLYRDRADAENNFDELKNPRPGADSHRVDFTRGWGKPAPTRITMGLGRVYYTRPCTVSTHGTPGRARL